MTKKDTEADVPRKTASVMCYHPTGVVLRNYAMVEGPLGIMTASAAGGPVTLRCGENSEVDHEFITNWLKANEENDLVTRGVVRLKQDGE